MINSTIEIVPHGFMHGRQDHRFYDMPEYDIFKLAYNHYHPKHKPLSEFSSLASSLHLVLCYAKAMEDWKNAHIAVMDRQQLDGDVLVWHFLRFLGYGAHEYMAHGCVRGKEYTAVPFTKLVAQGLYTIFPEQLQVVESRCYLGNQTQQLLRGPQLWKEQVASKQST